ncbi:hypothetical protein, partial [uncultured Duncaniella sp.]
SAKVLTYFGKHRFFTMRRKGYIKTECQKIQKINFSKLWGGLFFRGIVKIRKAVSELRSSGMMVAPARVTMKNGGRRPEFFMVARHGVDDKFHIMGIEDVR